MHAIIQTQKWI